ASPFGCRVRGQDSLAQVQERIIGKSRYHDHFDIAGNDATERVKDAVGIQLVVFGLRGVRKILVALDRSRDKAQKIARVVEERQGPDRLVQMASTCVNRQMQYPEKNVGKTHDD